MSIMASSAWTNPAGILSTPADFPIFSALTAASTSSPRNSRLLSNKELILLRLNRLTPFLRSAFSVDVVHLSFEIYGYACLFPINHLILFKSYKLTIR